MRRLIPFLSAKSPAILEKWLDILLGSYSPDTVRFLKMEKDPFSNPVAHQLNRGLTDILAVLVEDLGVEEANAALDEVIRVLALQDAPPSRALAFIFTLKQVIREVLAEELEDLALAPELLELESRIDGLALLGFDGYTKRREKLCELKVNEVKARVSGLLRRAGIEIDNP
uniref:RsbT co-antagonist protein RsbRD N-terminal domain-containing protein n=1 Tax=Desulfobacca acetoxidans TaxID=60893 RepID=A0A7C3V5Z2_9BACT